MYILFVDCPNCLWGEKKICHDLYEIHWKNRSIYKTDFCPECFFRWLTYEIEDIEWESISSYGWDEEEYVAEIMDSKCLVINEATHSYTYGTKLGDRAED